MLLRVAITRRADAIVLMQSVPNARSAARSRGRFGRRLLLGSLRERLVQKCVCRPDLMRCSAMRAPDRNLHVTHFEKRHRVGLDTCRDDTPATRAFVFQHDGRNLHLRWILRCGRR